MAVPDFHSLYEAWRQCRRRKAGTPQAQRYEVGLLDELTAAEQALRAGCWHPAPPVCFAVSQPKAREIHAAAFADRVVHHWLVPRLEALYEPLFIHDLYSNRKGRGTHAAVKRLQGFMHSLKATQSRLAPNGTDGNRTPHGGYYLQLDIQNFFNSIDRPRLFALLQRRLRQSVRAGRIDVEEARFLRDLAHTILKQDVAGESRCIADRELLQRVPAHKRLLNAGPGKGLPIGNLTSQFFANVYLNELDQFVKHRLKCSHYLRYVDDFILLHHDAAQLAEWKNRIVCFLDAHLLLGLRRQSILKPCGSGADFLGYIVKPHYCLVRRRVIGNLRKKLDSFARQLFPAKAGSIHVLHLSEERRRKLQSVLASYLGHFSHAQTSSLLERLFRQYPWLDLLFMLRGTRLIARWEPVSVSGYKSQVAWFRRHFPHACMLIQRGTETDLFTPDRLPRHGHEERRPVITERLIRPSHTPGIASGLSAGGNHPGRRRKIDRETAVQSPRDCVERIIVNEQGYLKGGMKRRVLTTMMVTAHADGRAPA